MKPMLTAALAAVGVVAVFAGVTPVKADTYPSRTVTIIVPYSAGGPTDQTARQLASFLTKKLGQSFIVENVTGGSTIVATNRLAKATPDGYTLLLHNLQITANVTLFKSLPFNTAKDIIPIMLINKNPLILVGRPGLAPNTLKGLIALMKKQRLREALPGYGTTGHLTSALFAREAKVKIDFIPYRGATPAMNDLLGNHVDVYVGTPSSIVPFVKAGKLKAYGITSKHGLPLLPNVQSMVDVLGPKFEIAYWQAMFAPAGTPAPVIKTLNAALQQAVTDPDTIKHWAVQGFTAFPKSQRTQAAAEAFMKSEIARWGGVIRDNNIHVNQ